MKWEALIVGISQYPLLKDSPTRRSPHLSKTVADAEAIAQRLKESGGDAWNVRLMTGTVSQPDLLQAISDLFPSQTNQPPEVALLFFAGHGLRQKIQSEKSASYEGFLATSDANPRTDKWGISLIELRKIILKSKVKRQIVWLDCCHSGELLNFLTEDELKGWLEGGDRLLIAACRDDKTAYGVGEHGVLTQVLLKALDPAQQPKGEWISSWSLKKFIDRELEINEYLKRQIPLVENFGREIEFWRVSHELTGERSPDSSRLKTPFSCFAYNETWVGREELINQLSTKILGECRILTLTGITGIGKTALAERLAVELQKNWTEFNRINFDDKERVTDFASVAADLLTSWQETVTPDDRQDPQRLLSRLAKRLQNRRYLLVIDSLERILEGNEETGWSDFKDERWVSFFESLMTAETCQSRIVVTSQDLPRQLEEIGYRYPNFWHPQDLSGLTEPERLEFFEKRGLDVSAESPGKPYLTRIGSAYEGHPLALRAIAGEIANKPFHGNVVAYWKKYGREIEEVEQARAKAEIKSVDDKFQLERYTSNLRTAVQKRVELTFERLAQEVFNAYLLLCHGAVYRRPVTEDWWFEHLEYLGCDTEQQEAALNALRDRYLVEEEIIDDEFFLRQHNLIRSVALAHLKKLTTRQQSV